QRSQCQERIDTAAGGRTSLCSDCMPFSAALNKPALTCHHSDCCQLPINTYGMLISPQGPPLQGASVALYHR
ncbi:unnamed protein product, partial [Gadus morhua 'NCC']